MSADKNKSNWRLILVVGLVLGLCLSSGLALGQTEAPADKTLSPYFFVKGDEAGTDQLPLKSTAAKVNISGVIAEVTILQRYQNQGKNTLEAVYIFPASSKAAVHYLKMKIGERVIVARIKEREAARADYEHAREEGRAASLLEQERPNVFQVSVANILPGDEIEVELGLHRAVGPQRG